MARSCIPLRLSSVVRGVTELIVVDATDAGVVADVADDPVGVDIPTYSLYDIM
jgi:hypothetical protein